MKIERLETRARYRCRWTGPSRARWVRYDGCGVVLVYAYTDNGIVGENLVAIRN